MGPNSAVHSFNAASTAAKFLNAITGKLDVEQACDLADMYVQYAGTAGMMAGAAASLKKAGVRDETGLLRRRPGIVFLRRHDRAANARLLHRLVPRKFSITP